MVSVIFYFQVHQPYRLREDFTIFDIGKNEKNYFDIGKNKFILKKVAEKSYIPTNKTMLKLLKKHEDFKISYSITGTVLEQFEEYYPEVLTTFQELKDTKRVEFLNETSHHSLSYIFSKKEFFEQIKLHKKLMKKYFNVNPKIFRNTELIFHNNLAKDLEEKGYKGVLAEGADKILGWRNPNYIYKTVNSNIPLLLKNYRLSDDIAFRFSNKHWKEWPLTADKFSSWVNQINGNGEVVNLFMDYETFGEHQWKDTGIFEFLKHLPKKILEHKDNNFLTPSEAIKKYPIRGEVDFNHYVSWADLDRDLSAWMGNKMQDTALKEIYEIEKIVKKTKDKNIIETWRKLLTSDHFYYMCTKYFSDGDVHKYFSPYDSPYDAFITFMNVLEDFKLKLKSYFEEKKALKKEEKKLKRII